MTARSRVLTCLVFAVCLATSGLADTTNQDPPEAGGGTRMPKLTGPLFNQDCTDFFYTNYITEDKDAGAEIDRYFDVLADAGVKVLLINTNARKTNYKSEVWETFWDGYDPKAGDDHPFIQSLGPGDTAGYRRMTHSMMEIDRQGVDYPARVIERCRVRGVSPWISLRMNDVHFNDNLDHPFHGAIWRQEEFHRGGGGYYGRGLDYAHAEVRDLYRALIVESLGRYDMDGLELDFMREPYLFRPGAEQEGRAILTQWIREISALVKEAAEKRGHPILLGVRMPSHVEVALSWGLDAPAWAREGLIDLVVATPRWATLEYDMPLGDWKQALEGTGVTLAGGLEILHRPMPSGPAVPVTREQAAGAATAVLAAGADAVYLFNYFSPIANSPAWTPEGYRTTLSAMSSLDAISALPRRHAITWRDIVGCGEQYQAPLPAEGKSLSFQIPTGPKPADNARVWVEVHVEKPDSPPIVSLNGKTCNLREGETGAAGALIYDAPANALPGMQRDTVGIAAVGDATVKVMGVEIRIGP